MMSKQAKQKAWFTGSLLFIALLIKIISYNSSFVELHYSQSVYVFISQALRILFGWIPFSIGDVLYFLAGFWLLIRLVKLIRLFFKKQYTKSLFFRDIHFLLRVALVVYILFNALWGLNYDRRGIAFELQLQAVTEYKDDLYFLTASLLDKVNATRQSLPAGDMQLSNEDCYAGAVAAYKNLSQTEASLQYNHPSVKPSFYSLMGNYLGFSGYYNPFTGEAQVNVRTPRFLLPYVTCHEMAHQLGYASEDEANFVGYLAARSSTDKRFQYSVYFDLFNYANSELFLLDSATARKNYKNLDTLVKKDIQSYRAFLKAYQNPLEPIITRLYGNYLKANKQPQGIQTYSQVIALLIAYNKLYQRL